MDKSITTDELKGIIAYAKANPDSDLTTQFRQRVESGMYRSQLAQIRAEKSAQAAKDAESVGGMALETGKELVKNIARPVAKAAVTAYEAPGVLLSGGKTTGKTYDVPGLGPIQSSQTEAANETAQLNPNSPDYGLDVASVVAGKTGDAAGDVAAALGAGQMAKNAVKAAAPVVKNAASAVSDIADTAADKYASSVNNLGTKMTERNVAKNTQNLVNKLTPELTPTEYAAAPKTEPGLFTRPRVMGEKLPEVQDAVRGVNNVASELNIDLNKVLGSSYNPIKTQNALKQMRSDYSEQVIKPLLSENKTPFDFAGLIDRFKMVKPSASLAEDANALKTYNRVGEQIQEVIAKNLRKTTSENPTDFNDIWNANKEVDKMIEKELGDTALSVDQTRGVKAAAQDFRDEFRKYMSDSLRYPGQADAQNKFIEALSAFKKQGIDVTDDMLPEIRKQVGLVENPEAAAVADKLDQSMKNLHDLFKASNNIESSVKAVKGKSKVGAYMKKNPISGNAVKYGIGAGIGALGTGAIMH